VTRVLAALDRGLARAENALAWAAILILLFITASVCIDVFLRSALNRPLVWVTEVSEYALAYITFLGAAWVLRNHGHVNVDAVVVALPRRVQAVCLLLGHIIGLLVCLILLRYGISATWSAYARGLFRPTTLALPTWLTLIPVPVGALVLSLRFALESVRAWGALRTGAPVDWQATTSVE
jgi:TRAP-type C4-dicarboxylate transport system permease small subunit